MFPFDYLTESIQVKLIQGDLRSPARRLTRILALCTVPLLWLAAPRQQSRPENGWVWPRAGLPASVTAGKRPLRRPVERRQLPVRPEV